MNNYRIKCFLAVAAVIFFIAAFFSDPVVMSRGIRRGLSICASTVIPSLFPFIVLSDFLIRSGLSGIIGKTAEKFTEKVFRLPGSASCVIIMSLIGGFPVGAKMISQLVDSGDISRKNGRRMLLFCVNGGPAFVIGAVGTSMLSSRRAGVILYVSLVIASLLTGFLTRFIDYGEESERKIKLQLFDPGVLTESVAKSTQTMLNICSWILVFLCISEYCTKLPVSSSTMDWISMASEVTSGCMTAVGKFPYCVTALITGWSGFSVHCQVYPFVKKTGLKMYQFMLARLFNGGLALAIAWLIFRIFPCEISVFSSASELLAKPYSISVPAGAAMLILGAFTVLDLDLARNKKV